MATAQLRVTGVSEVSNVWTCSFRAAVYSANVMGSRSFADYGIDPLGLSAEENEQVADLIDQNNDLLNEVRDITESVGRARVSIGVRAACRGMTCKSAHAHAQAVM